MTSLIDIDDELDDCSDDCSSSHRRAVNPRRVRAPVFTAPAGSKTLEGQRLVVPSPALLRLAGRQTGQLTFDRAFPVCPSVPRNHPSPRLSTAGCGADLAA